MNPQEKAKQLISDLAQQLKEIDPDVTFICAIESLNTSDSEPDSLVMGNAVKIPELARYLELHSRKVTALPGIDPLAARRGPRW